MLPLFFVTSALAFRVYLKEVRIEEAAPTEHGMLLQTGVQSGFTSELVNLENNAYVGKLYIGGQPAWLSFDTGSEWLTVASGYRHVYKP